MIEILAVCVEKSLTDAPGGGVGNDVTKHLPSLRFPEQDDKCWASVQYANTRKVDKETNARVPICFCCLLAEL